MRARTRVAELLDNTSRRLIDWGIIALAVLNILFLTIVLGITIRTSQDAATRQAENVRSARAVVRCALTEELNAVTKIADDLGLPVHTRPPNTEGLNCKLILNSTLEDVGG